MHFRITGDVDSQSGLEEIILDCSQPTRMHFLSQEYGSSVVGICVVLMCQDPRLNLKRRIRFSKAEKILFLDIMLDLEAMRRASMEERKRQITARVIEQVPEVLRRYKFQEFDIDRFQRDLIEWFANEKRQHNIGA